MVKKIADELEQIKHDFLEKEAKNWKNKFHQGFSVESLYPWPAILCKLLCFVALMVYWSFNQEDSSVLVVAIVLLLFVVLNCYLVIWSEAKVRKHFVAKLNNLTQSIKDLSCKKDITDIVKDFKKFLESCSSTSFLNGPSHSFSNLYINEFDEPIRFPTSLLSTDNVIGISSGVKAICKMKCAQDGCVTFNTCDIVSKELVPCINDQLSEVESNLFMKFVILESPIVEIIKTMSDRFSSMYGVPLSPLSKMLSKFRLQCFRFTVVLLTPAIVILSVVSSILWEMFSTDMLPQFSDSNNATNIVATFIDNNGDFVWLQNMLLHIVLILISVLLVTCPVFWFIPYVISETKTATSKNMGSLISILREMLFGKSQIFSNDVVKFDDLGSVTVLCCLNKEGILSWYEPAPDKVFFFNQSIKKNSSQDSFKDLEENDTLKETNEENSARKVEVKKTNVEILTLSQDSQNSDKLHFDELNWQQHISSLKTICLNILVTNPNFKFDEEILMSRFRTENEKLFGKELLIELHQCHDQRDETSKPKLLIEHIFSQHEIHLNHLASENDFQKPGGIHLRDGLLKLTQLVGFSPEVLLLQLPKSLTTIYKTRDQLTDCFKLHEPLSYVHSFQTQESNTLKGNNYWFSSGSCDLILEVCSKYWDGSEIQTLTEDLRKKALDFYQRSAVTGDCVAFSIRNATKGHNNTQSCIAKYSKEVSGKNEEVFLGMVSLQYQARIQIIRLIETLESSLIRFVHFSVDNEFRSRVFAEKMGLEAGWNCHISLSPSKLKTSRQPTSSNSINENNLEGQSEPLIRIIPNTPGSESTISENAFHMRNRAKLPRGVDNIIPHLEDVDNVPLLVQLFTDCNNNSSSKMIEIMQNYGERVCCIGSSDFFQNIPVFSQSDVSFAIQPILHSQSSAETLPKEFSFHSRTKLDSTSQFSFNTELNSTTYHDHEILQCARKLNTFSCHEALSSERSLNHIYNLIKKARRMLTLTQSCFDFFIQCLTIVSVTQLLAHLSNLTLVFGPGDVLWICFLIIPFLSFSILGSTKFDNEVLPFTMPIFRQTKIKKVFKTALLITVTRCLPTSLVLFILYILTIQSSCFSIQIMVFADLHLNESVPLTRCFSQYTIFMPNTTTQMDFSQYLPLKIRESQQLCTCFLVLYLCVISLSHVYRQKLLLRQSPFTNKTWLLTVVVIFLLQLIYSSIVLTTYNQSGFENVNLLGTWHFKKHKVAIWCVSFLWILLCVVINEFVKWKEIQNLTRSQKRARLAFETKLGMNSPF